MLEPLGRRRRQWTGIEAAPSASMLAVIARVTMATKVEAVSCVSFPDVSWPFTSPFGGADSMPASAPDGRRSEATGDWGSGGGASPRRPPAAAPRAVADAEWSAWW